MKRQRVRFTVEIDLDPVYGFNHDPQDFADRERRGPTSSCPWYRPTVSVAELVPEGEEHLPE